MDFTGLWHITEMEMWDKEYLNMETQAYIRINDNDLGRFQFGLVAGELDGQLVTVQGSTRYEFTWEGNDEMDPVSGSGWLRLIDRDTVDGSIKIHRGDSSTLSAFRVR